MKRYSVFLLVTLASFVIVTIAVAEVPSAISYQGRLTTPAGTPVTDANYTVVFTIYDAATSGISKWTETQSVTTSGGLFSVPLGSVAPISDTVFSGSTRYLGVKIGADPELTPRTALVAVPYAHRVSTVDGASGGTILGSTIITNPRAGFSNVLSLSSNANTANLDLIPQINGTGVLNVNTVGSLAFAIASNRYMTIANDGNIGIGTTTPEDKLHVAGTIRADQFRGPLVVNGGNITYAADGGDHIFTTATQERMRVTVDGNVGIGTTSPGDKLEVGEGGNVVLKAAGDDPGDIIFRTSTGVEKGRIWSEPSAGSNKLHLRGGSQVIGISIDSVGNVGVGTTTPDIDAKLSVNGYTFAKAPIVVYDSAYSPYSATFDISWARDVKVDNNLVQQQANEFDFLLKKPGFYRVSTFSRFSCGTTIYVWVSIYKNGISENYIDGVSSTLTTAFVSGSVVVQSNGSDIFKIHASSSGGQSFGVYQNFVLNQLSIEYLGAN